MNAKFYLIDTNVLVTAKNFYYSFAICPGFWDSLIYHHSKSSILSIDKVKKEINDYYKDDELKSWVNSAIPDLFFKSSKDEAILSAYNEINNWVQGNLQFYPEAKSAFIEDPCDPWLIAYAKANINDCILVTHEQFREDVKNKVPIPNVCKEFHIDHTTIFDMLTKLGVRFVL